MDAQVRQTYAARQSSSSRRSRAKTSTIHWGTRAAILVLLSAVLVVPLSAVLAFALRSPVGRIGPESYERVHDGMQQTEVMAALGLPPGDYRDRSHRPGGHAFTDWSEEAATVEFGGTAVDRLHWEGNEYSIATGFDEAGRLAWKTLWRHETSTPRTPMDKLARRLGW
jgi:hypothetical protein